MHQLDQDRARRAIAVDMRRETWPTDSIASTLAGENLIKHNLDAGWLRLISLHVIDNDISECFVFNVTQIRRDESLQDIAPREFQ